MANKYRGFTKGDKRISQFVHGGDAVDVGDSPWGTDFYAPWRSGVATKRKYWVILANRIDKNASNVRYTAIQDVTDAGEQIIFGYFHTDVSPLYEGQYIYSGDFVVKNADNGITDGAHLHLVTRLSRFSVKTNPLPWLDIQNGILLGMPPVANAKPKNYPKDTKLTATEDLRLRESADKNSKQLGTVTANKTAIVVKDGGTFNQDYEWANVSFSGLVGYIVVQNTVGEQYVKAELPVVNPCQPVIDENTKLKAENTELHTRVDNLATELKVYGETITKQEGVIMAKDKEIARLEQEKKDLIAGTVTVTMSLWALLRLIYDIVRGYLTNIKASKMADKKELSKLQIAYVRFNEWWDSVPTPIKVVIYGIIASVVTTTIDNLKLVDINNVVLWGYKITPEIMTLVIAYTTNVLVKILEIVTRTKANLEKLKEQYTAQMMGR